MLRDKEKYFENKYLSSKINVYFIIKTPLKLQIFYYIKKAINGIISAKLTVKNRRVNNRYKQMYNKDLSLPQIYQ